MTSPLPGQLVVTDDKSDEKDTGGCRGSRPGWTMRGVQKINSLNALDTEARAKGTLPSASDPFTRGRAHDSLALHLSSPQLPDEPGV